MKTLFSIFAAFLFVAFVANTTFAQTEDDGTITDETTVVDGTVCDGTGVPLNDGSGMGLHGMGSGAGIGAGIMERGGDFQEAFKATLTEEQLAIIENIELTRDEKREALQSTFTEAQQELYDGHMADVAERQALRGSGALSEEGVENAVRKGWQRGRN
ncbi:hypothetical protein [uncultured Draconibacterium sp.]|uniref:hypothetical protein n=1 Tax=uncultured Draconibacterium sp. TaxID=1573823 RepID=UPI002AA656D0|nr:hypothetical protein [uncultured Draconibacterium sp.]